MRRKVLVAGFSTRHVAQSAWGAGWEVYAADHFCDQDLSFYTRDRISFEDLEDLPGAVEELCRRHSPEVMVVTSGAEMLPSRNLCGTSPERASRLLDKLDTHRFFEEIGIPAPALLPEGNYPAMLKPRNGSGGWRNRIVTSDNERKEWVSRFGDIPAISEEIVSGVPCSVSCLADGREARAVAVNRQILRGDDASEFGFSGSVTPFRSDREEELISHAERIAAASGCLGSIGVDFVSGDRVTAIEVNPRFQATLDTIEMATGTNIFAAHVAACRGRFPGQRPPCRQVAIRKILFAGRDVTVQADLRRLHPSVADIPRPGSFFEEGQAVLSVYGWGSGEEEAFALLDKHIRIVHQYMGGKLYARGPG
jgi:predicted ATP-grasp superfamily ATP-dependent carboligase